MSAPQYGAAGGEPKSSNAILRPRRRFVDSRTYAMPRQATAAPTGTTHNVLTSNKLQVLAGQICRH